MFSVRQLQILDELPPVAPAVAPTTRQPPAECVWCGACPRAIPLAEVRSYFTGLCRVMDQTCSHCMQGREQHAPIVCVTCQAVIARIPPHKDPSGFVFEPRHFYHVNSCPNCAPERSSSTLLEKLEFERRSRR